LLVTTIIAAAVQVGSADVCVAITDHGPGIAVSRQAHLFERFVRPGAETVRAQGVGLGLVIVKLVYRVRQKIEGLGTNGQYIETIPGVGYTIARDR
jgi:K+-sensing histidine kinase KdpD